MNKTNKKYTICNSYDSAVKTNAAFKYQASCIPTVKKEDIADIEAIYVKAYSRYNSYMSQVSKGKASKEYKDSAFECLRTITMAEAKETAEQAYETLMQILPIMTTKAKVSNLAKIYKSIIDFCDNEGITIEEFAKDLVEYYS